jgi:prepilin-type N-terminal cleavage/methylation domain-containing protein
MRELMNQRLIGADRPAQQGFTLVELMMVIAVLGTLVGMAVMVSPSFVRTARADAGLAQALDVLRSAREMAISQRRNVLVEFTGVDVIRTTRIEIPAAQTPLRTVQLENRMRFLKESGVPDTPDKFGIPDNSAVAFGTPAPTQLLFTSEGTLVDQNGNIVNGTVFFSIPGQTNSARAISVFGATALIRVWRWDGHDWVE